MGVSKWYQDEHIAYKILSIKVTKANKGCFMTMFPRHLPTNENVFASKKSCIVWFNQSIVELPKECYLKCENLISCTPEYFLKRGLVNFNFEFNYVYLINESYTSVPKLYGYISRGKYEF